MFIPNLPLVSKRKICFRQKVPFMFLTQKLIEKNLKKSENVPVFLLDITK